MKIKELNFYKKYKNLDFSIKIVFIIIILVILGEIVLGVFFSPSSTPSSLSSSITGASTTSINPTNNDNSIDFNYIFDFILGVLILIFDWIKLHISWHFIYSIILLGIVYTILFGNKFGNILKNQEKILQNQENLEWEISQIKDTLFNIESQFDELEGVQKSTAYEVGWNTLLSQKILDPTDKYLEKRMEKYKNNYMNYIFPDDKET